MHRHPDPLFIPMFRPSASRRTTHGFSLLELVITLSLISILVGVVSFRSTAVLDKGKISAIAQMAKQLKTACAMYHSDTNLLANEYAGGTPAQRQLSATQATVAGWSGPYLEKPLSDNGSNPYGRVRVYNRVNVGGWIPGFDLDGDGNVDVATVGNMMWLTGIEANVAESLDRTLDQGVAGTWEDTGSFRYSPANKHAYVLIYQ